MSRDDLTRSNAAIIRSVAISIKKHAPDSVVITVTNPLDTMTQLMQQETGFPPARVIGMAGVLDSARFRWFAAEAAGVPAENIDVMVLGSHGDLMVPLIGSAKAGGKPLAEVIPAVKAAELVKRTQNGGAEIVALLKQGSAYYAPAGSVVRMVRELVRPSGTVLPICVRDDGTYGFEGLYLGLPVRLAKNGVGEIVKLDLSPEEKKMLADAADALRAGWAILQK
jgi:malate dehydrogenase